MGRRSASGPLSFLSWRESLAWLVANNDVSAAGLVWLKPEFAQQQRPERASGERAGCSADLGQHRGRSSTAEHSAIQAETASSILAALQDHGQVCSSGRSG